MTQVVKPLSKRESEVCDLVLEGKTNSEIGAILGISKRTVELYRAKILLKYNIPSMTEMLRAKVNR